MLDPDKSLGPCVLPTIHLIGTKRVMLICYKELSPESWDDLGLGMEGLIGIDNKGYV